MKVQIVLLAAAASLGLARPSFLGPNQSDALEARGECRWYLGGCEADADCCEHLRCHSRYKWCIWDGDVKSLVTSSS
ncbi:hypothetical protein HIM_08116 [Hirsutella minnesotensis 3608]|uniref:Uncharacterized protein n=1 Tax=Hirsutella minnesotensis 3608 TaxID=1043627 RepID=A0A0F7ZYG8_9HYPO|nr:hypothetical protein HIM_08116 [Hirsutella minnesotensis 3608]